MLHNPRHHIPADAFGTWVSLRPLLSLRGHWSLPPGPPSMCRAAAHSQAAWCRAGTPASRALEGPGDHWFGAVGRWPLCGASSTLGFQRKVISPLGALPWAGNPGGGGDSEALPAFLAVLVEPCLSGPPQSWPSWCGGGTSPSGTGQAPPAPSAVPALGLQCPVYIPGPCAWVPPL